MGMAERIKELRLAAGMSQEELGFKLGLGKSAIAKYENGRVKNIKQSTIKKMAEIFNCQPSYLMGFDDEPQSDSHLPANAILPSARSLPIIGTICAGDGIVCEDDFQGHFIIDLEVSADYCLRVHGDSMIGADIFDGDIVFIKRATEFVSGKIYAVEFNMTNEASLKRVNRDGDSIVLTPCNPDYNIMVTDLSEVRIVGRLVGVYHSYV
ncbi:LexA family protein [Mobilibacterium timonense]|uniref:LexA family protein n=1 Tax=Mobilibacterium timonense TaxID=1871012 RepID=UPI000985ABA1|nr:XRE family transcriptional regulator [Mobilibacterium timonense]